MKTDTNWTPLHEAAKGTVEEVNELLNAGCNPNVTDRLGVTPLYVAARYGTAETVNALLSAGGDLMARDVYGSAPIHVDGLKRACDVEEVSDEAAAEGEKYTEDEDQVVASWTAEEWWKIRHPRAYLLVAGERGETDFKSISHPLTVSPPRPSLRSVHRRGREVVGRANYNVPRQKLTRVGGR